MGASFSLLVIAAGAILAFAVSGSPSGIDLQTVGWILIVVGIVALMLSLVLWDGWLNRAPRAPRRPPHP